MNLGRNNPNDSGKCYYNKDNMYRHNNGLKPVRCFAVKYNGYKVPCGYNLDFFSCELISDLIFEIDTGGLMCNFSWDYSQKFFHKKCDKENFPDPSHPGGRKKIKINKNILESWGRKKNCF